MQLLRGNSVSNVTFIVIQANVPYYLFLSPYRLKLTPEGKVVLESTSVRKIFCIVSNALIIWIRIASHIVGFIKNGDGLNSQIYELIDNFSYVTGLFTFLHFVWFRTKEVSEVIHLYSELCPKHDAMNRTLTLLAAFGPYTYSLIHLYNNYSKRLTLASSVYWRGYYKIFLKSLCFGIPCSVFEIPAEFEYAASAFAVLATIVNYMWTIISEVAVSGLVCNIIFQVGLQLEKISASFKNLKYSEFKTSLEKLLELLDGINLHFRIPMLMFTTSSATLFCKFFRVAFKGDNFFTIMTLSYLMICFSFLSMAAEGERRLSRAVHGCLLLYNKEAAKEDVLNKDNQDDPTLALDFHDISFSAKVYSFDLTYGLILKILSTVFTYNLLYIQLMGTA